MTDFRRYPCTACPWRRDADMAKLRAASTGVIPGCYGKAEVETMLAAPSMACHLDQPGTAHPMRLCAGWLAVVGPHHARIRLAVAAGHLPAEALSAKPGWPALYRDLEELLAYRPDSGTGPNR